MSKGTVLVIEDNRDILDAMRLLLEQDEFTVITAENCSTGIDDLAFYQPDVILTDLMLPEMTGLEFIRLVRRVANYDHIPIVAISAYDKTYLIAAIAAGAECALHKPEDLDSLVKTINQVLERKYRGRAMEADRRI